MNNQNEKGQVLIIIALSLVALLGFAALAIDGGRWYLEIQKAEYVISQACVEAGYGGYQNFVFIMERNHRLSQDYSPNEGTGDGLTRGYEIDPGNQTEKPSLRTAMQYSISTTFFKVLGIQEMPIRVQARCTLPHAKISPIAVKTTAFQDSLNNGTEQSILGQGSQADIDVGKSYRGAVFMGMKCVGYCLPVTTVSPPYQPSPPSAQISKNVFMSNCWSTTNCDGMTYSIGDRIPVVAGTSDNQLCQAASTALNIGDEVVVIIYNGTVNKDSFGWDNVAIQGYALFKITSYGPNKNNCNTIGAIALDGIFSNLREIKALQSQEIPWFASGGWQ